MEKKTIKEKHGGKPLSNSSKHANGSLFANLVSDVNICFKKVEVWMVLIRCPSGAIQWNKHIIRSLYFQVSI